MPRRSLQIAAAVLFALAGVVAVVYLQRAALLRVALEELLTEEGFPDARFEVASFDLGGLTLADLSLGENAPSARRLSVRFHFWDDSPAVVEVDGFAYPVAAGGGGASLCDTLDRFLSPPSLGVVSWPKVVLRGALVTLPGSRGEIRVSADGTVELAKPAFALGGAVSAAHTDAAYRIQSTAGGAKLQATLTGESDVADLPWPERYPAPDSGHAAFKLDAELPAPKPGAPVCGTLLSGPVTARGDLVLDSVSIPDRVAGLAADAGIEATAAKGTLHVSLTRPMRLSAATLSLPALDSLPPALAGRISHGGTATLAAADPEKPLLRIARDGDGWSPRANAELKLSLVGADANLRLSGTAHLGSDLGLRALDDSQIALQAHGIPAGFGEISALSWKAEAEGAGGTFTASGPLDLRLDKLTALPKSSVAFRGPVTLTAAPPEVAVEAATATLGVTGAPGIGALALDGPLKLAVAKARLVRDENAVVLDAVFDPGTVSGRVLREAGPVPFRAAPGPVSVHAVHGETLAGELGLKKGSVVLPAQRIAAESIAAAIPFGATPAPHAGRISATLRSNADPAPFASLALSMKLTEKKGLIAGKGTLGVAGRKIRAPVTAHFDPAAGRGSAHLGPVDLDFASGGLQPRDLSPLLATLQKAAGAAEVEAAVGYDSSQGVKGTGKIAFKSLSFAAPQADVAGLNGTVEFLDLFNPRTPPRQTLTADHVTAGATLDDVAVKFALAPEDGTPVLALDDAAGGFAGGRLSVRDATIRAGAANPMTIHVDALSLAKLFESLGTDSVKGTGTLTGAIPIEIGGGAFAIADGKLTAQGPGVLQVNLGSARATLEKQSQAMGLMVRAMEDFHYKALEIGVTRKPGKDIVMTVKLEGDNPAVLDGYPFRFNINLSGDLDRLLAAVRAGSGLTADVLERAVEVDR